MNQRRDGPDKGHEKAPFNSAELTPPPTRTESFWEPFQRLKCCLKERNGLADPSCTRKTRRTGASGHCTPCSSGLSCYRMALHPLVQIWRQSRLTTQGCGQPSTCVAIAREFGRRARSPHETVFVKNTALISVTPAEAVLPRIQ